MTLPEDESQPEQPLEYGWIRGYEQAQLQKFNTLGFRHVHVASHILHDDGQFERAMEAVLVALFDGARP